MAKYTQSQLQDMFPRYGAVTWLAIVPYTLAGAKGEYPIQIHAALYRENGEKKFTYLSYLPDPMEEIVYGVVEDKETICSLSYY